MQGGGTLFVSQALIFLSSIFLFFLYTSKSGSQFINKTETRAIVVFFTASFFLAIAVNWFFCDIFSNLFLAKLFIVNYFKYPSMVLIFLLLKYFDNKLISGEGIAVALLCAMVFFKQGALYFILPLTAYEFIKLNFDSKSVLFILIVIFITSIFYLSFFNIPLRYINLSFWTFIIIISIIFIHFFRGQPRFPFVLIALLATVLSLFSITKDGIKRTFKSPEESLIAMATPEVYNISKRFKEYTTPEAKVLTDPFDGKADWFPLISHRGTYVSWKMFAETMAGVYEWVNRIDQTVWRDFYKLTAEQMHDLLNQIGYDYVLLKNPNPTYNNSEKLILFLKEGQYSIYTRVKKELNIGDIISFSNKNLISPQKKYLLSGWSGQEDWGTWSDGNKAELRLYLSEGVSRLEFLFSALVTPSHPEQKVIVKVNGNYLKTEVFNQPSDNILLLDIPDDIKEGGGVIEMEFELPNAATPKSLGINNDNRLLAIGLISMEVK
jgi:hypothetical protein